MVWEGHAGEAGVHMFRRDAFGHELAQGRGDTSLQEVCSKAIKGDKDSRWCKEGGSIRKKHGRWGNLRRSRDFVGSKCEQSEKGSY